MDEEARPTFAEGQSSDYLSAPAKTERGDRIGRSTRCHATLARLRRLTLGDELATFAEADSSSVTLMTQPQFTVSRLPVQGRTAGNGSQLNRQLTAVEIRQLTQHLTRTGTPPRSAKPRSDGIAGSEPQLAANQVSTLSR